MAETLINASISFLTDIITSYDGHEQRLKVRQSPRLSYSFTYDAMTKFDAQWLKSIIRIPKTDIYYVPMWHRGCYLSEDYYAGGVMYIDEEFEYCFNNCDVFEVFVRDSPLSSFVNEYRNIKRFGAGYVGLNKRVEKYLLASNTWIFPMRPCYIQTPAKLDYVYANGASTAIVFEDCCERASIKLPNNYINNYQQHDKYNPFKLPEFFNNRVVCLLTPQWVEDSDTNLSVDKLFNTMDTKTGILQYDLRNAKSYDLHTLAISLMSIQQINNMYRFFYQMSGRYKSFYCPTWVNDIEVALPFEATAKAIYTEMPLEQFYKNNTRRKYIVVFTKDWKSFIFRIDDISSEYVVDKLYTKLMVYGDIYEDIPLNNILMVSFFNLVRFNSDDLSLGFESNTVANTTITLQEVDDTE